MLDRIRHAMSEKLAVAEAAIAVRLSLGGAIWKPGTTVDQMLAEADIQMYQDKAAHRVYAEDCG
jgi:GGDEF domain-containing protein